MRLDKEEIDAVSDLRYSWRKTLQVSNEMNAMMADLQIGFKRELMRNVKDLVADVAKFRIDFEANGPMVPRVTNPNPNPNPYPDPNPDPNPNPTLTLTLP